MKMSFYARSPAQCAAAAACGEALDLLLASGAAVRVRDKMKLTLLHDAARGGDVACVRAVLRGGGAADVEARDKWGRTPLTWCVLEQSVCVCVCVCMCVCVCVCVCGCVIHAHAGVF